MPGAAQLMQFDWSGVRTDKNDRKILPGELTDLVNVRYPKDGGSPEKRSGHDKATISVFSGGTYAGPAVDMLAAPTEMWRDSGDQIWARDGSTGYYRGTDPRAFPTWTQVQNLSDYAGAHKQLSALANGDCYLFTLGVKVGAGIGYQVTVFDPTNGVVKLETTKVAADSITAYAVAADANGAVWLFYVNGSASIFAHKFSGPTTTPATTTYVTRGGEAFVSIDARLLTATGELAVVAMSAPGGGAGNLNNFHSYLDSTTGMAKSSPAPVLATFAGPGVGGPICAGGISVVNEDGTAGLLRYSFWRAKNSTNVQLMRVVANGGTLITTATTELFSVAGASSLVQVCSSGGFIDPNTGHEVYLSTEIDTGAGGDIPLITRALVRRHIVSGSVTTDIVARSAYLAGRPFEIGGAYYFLSGFDDGPITRAQRGYFVRTAAGAIVSTILDGAGASAFHAGGLINNTSPVYNYNQLGSDHAVTPLVLDDATVLIPLLTEGFTAGTPAPTLVTLAFNADFYSNADNVMVGGVPKYVSPQDVIRELAPMHFPYENAVITDGDGSALPATSLFTWLYATIDAQGRIVRSAPHVTVSHTFLGFASVAPSLGIPTARHTIGPTWIEIYGNVVTGDTVDLFLQHQLPNDPTVDSITVKIDPASWSDAGELLYTTGNALPNTKVPPARLAVVWRDRLWLAGTPTGTILPSQTIVQGHGWEFNPALGFEWHDGTGPVTAIFPLGDDALVVFKANAIGLITGLGPDGSAQGTPFRAATITTKKGVLEPRTVGPHPLGVVFQNAADGRYCLVTGSGVTEINQGQETYRSYAPNAVLQVESERGLRIPCDNGKMLFLDYEHALPDQPAGTWIRDEGSSLPAFVGARLIAGVPTLLEAGTNSTAAFWTPNDDNDDNGIVCLTDWTGGRMAPANFMGEFDTDRFQLSSTKLGGQSTYTYTVSSPTVDEVHPDVDSDVDDIGFRTALYRAREVKLRVQETSATGRGRRFDGVAIEFRPYGRLQNPYRRIA